MWGGVRVASVGLATCFARLFFSHACLLIAFSLFLASRLRCGQTFPRSTVLRRMRYYVESSNPLCPEGKHQSSHSTKSGFFAAMLRKSFP